MHIITASVFRIHCVAESMQKLENGEGVNESLFTDAEALKVYLDGIMFSLSTEQLQIPLPSD